VRSFGTEDRDTQFQIAPQSQIYDYILFRGSDIKDIRVVNNHTLPHHNDPAIMQAQLQNGPPQMPQHFPMPSGMNAPPQQQQQVPSQQQPPQMPGGGGSGGAGGAPGGGAPGYMSGGLPELGSKISLISKADIRYEGRLYTVDPQECTIALSSGKYFSSAPHRNLPRNC